MVCKRSVKVGSVLVACFALSINAWTEKFMHTYYENHSQLYGFYVQPIAMYMNNGLTSNEAWSIWLANEAWLSGTGIKNGPFFPNNCYTSAQPVTGDGISVIGMQPIEDLNTLGQTNPTQWFYAGAGWYFNEVDIIINSNLTWNEDWKYFNQNYPQCLGNSDWFSMLGVAMHELGHAHDIAHSSESDYAEDILKQATMYYETSSSGSASAATLNEYDVKSVRCAYKGTPYSNWYWDPSCYTYYYNMGWKVSRSQSTRSYPEGGSDQGTSIFVTPNGTGASWDYCVVDNYALKNSLIDQQTIVEWNQIDVSKSLYMQINIVDQNNNMTPLYYALNAPDWWSKSGWVNMSSDASKAGFDKWVTIDRNLYNDYRSEYGTHSIPARIYQTRVGHLVYTGSKTQTGGVVNGIFYK